MIWIANFQHEGINYMLMHNPEDDSRSVVAVNDPDRVLLHIDSSCYITAAVDTAPGDMIHAGMINSKSTMYVLHMGGETHELCPHRDWHWRALEAAECIAAPIIFKAYPSIIEHIKA